MAQKIEFKSFTIEKLEAVLRRIGPDHPARAKAESMLRASKSGDWGERSLDYYTSFLNKEEHLICQGLRLSSGQFHFQIDTLLIHSNFILILEVKNLSGTLIFDTRYNQLIQEIGNREEIYKDPIQQVNHQHFQFSLWLEKYKFPIHIPIYSYVIIANDKSKIVPKDNEELLMKKVKRPTKLLDLITNHRDNHQKEFLTKKNLRKIKTLFKKLHVPGNPDVLQKLNIPKDELMTGVHCPECYMMPMNRVHGKWICPDCHIRSKTAHLQALHDYFLLLHPSITNKQARDFLHINSIKASTRILTSLHVEYHGSTSNRTYPLHSLNPNPTFLKQ